MMTGVILVEAKTTVATRVIAWLVKVDEHLGVAQWTSTTIARNTATLHCSWWNLSNQIDGKTWVDLYERKRLKSHFQNLCSGQAKEPFSAFQEIEPNDNHSFQTPKQKNRPLATN